MFFVTNLLLVTILFLSLAKQTQNKGKMKRKGTKKENVIIREKKLAGGKISLYLDIYRSGQRSYEFLKLYILEKPRTPEERQKNNETLQLAENIRSKRESELNHQEFGFIPPHRQNINFLDFYLNYLDTYTKKDARMLKGSFEAFKNYLKGVKINPEKPLSPKLVNIEMVKEYREYLEKNFNGETPHSYFARFKKVLRKATDKGIFQKSPGEGLSITESKGLKKAILGTDEIQLLAGAHCGNGEVKRAFLFSCFTGLRFVDVNQLKFENIDFSNKFISLMQAKVKGEAKQVTINLSNTALKLIGEPGNPGELVFTLPSHNGCLKDLETWCKRAKINKHITWHSARHSFAVNLLSEAGANIKTVSSLLGHATLQHTEVYIHVVDKLKHDAVNNLPELNF